MDKAYTFDLSEKIRKPPKTQCFQGFFVVAEMGFEPHDLRVMSLKTLVFPRSVLLFFVLFRAIYIGKMACFLFIRAKSFPLVAFQVKDNNGQIKDRKYTLFKPCFALLVVA